VDVAMRAIRSVLSVEILEPIPQRAKAFGCFVMCSVVIANNLHYLKLSILKQLVPGRTSYIEEKEENGCDKK